jgi:alkanesulfonate monooxygenase SsuD/methylene tetrahydromethanopterin reductase-like flavin-dependent oxidoreductase (luciferase family)
MRLVVGGVGNVKTPRLAGIYADEYNVYPGTEEEFAGRVARAKAAAASAGRDPDAILFSSAGAVLTAPTEADYREKFAEAAASSGVTPEELEAHFSFRSTPRGSYEQVAETLAMMAAHGVTRFYLQRGAEFDQAEEESLLKYLRSSIG